MNQFQNGMRASLLAATVFAGGTAAAQTAVPGYKLSVFAHAPTGMTAPDSIISVGNSIWVGFGDGAAKDGTSGSSTVVEFSLKGAVRKVVTIAGHNDGLRLDPSTGKLVALQNEDANPTVAVIDPKTGAVTTPVALHSVNGGGGFDDIAFIGGRAFVTASNPTLDAKGVSRYPAIVDIVRNGGGFIYETVVASNTPGYNAVTGVRDRMNLTDPDSLTVTPDGNILMTDQADAQLLLVDLKGGSGPFVSQIPLLGGVQVDDTAYATSGRGTLFFTDTGSNVIYKLVSSHYTRASPYSVSTGVPASGSMPAVPAFIGKLYLDSGATVPLVTGLTAPHGMIFRAN